MSHRQDESLAPRSVQASLAFHLARQEALCAALELLADSLPHRIDTHGGLLLARGIRPTLHRAHRFEETVVHPLLMSHHTRLAGTLARLRGEHVEDADRGQEIREAVAVIVRDSSRRDAEMIGYMLRGFFSGLRRHLAFERDHLLPLLIDA
jgi:hypothetical protein